MLGIVVKEEKPELEQKREALVRELSCVCRGVPWCAADVCNSIGHDC